MFVMSTSSSITAKRKYEFGISFFVKVLWIVLSLLVSVACTYSFFKPQWFVNPSTDLCLGIINFCYEDMQFNSLSKNVKYIDFINEKTEFRSESVNQQTKFGFKLNRKHFDQIYHKKEKFKICRVYGGSHFLFSYLPSDFWQIACITFGIGCLLGCSSAILSIVTIVMKSTIWIKRLACYTGFLQASTALLFTSGLLILPFGMDSKLARHICKGSFSYNLGNCTVGWPYILSAMSTALSFFCPFLSRHINLE